MSLASFSWLTNFRNPRFDSKDEETPILDHNSNLSYWPAVRGVTQSNWTATIERRRIWQDFIIVFFLESRLPPFLSRDGVFYRPQGPKVPLKCFRLGHRQWHTLPSVTHEIHSKVHLSVLSSTHKTFDKFIYKQQLKTIERSEKK